jgi:hypothetical protein
LTLQSTTNLTANAEFNGLDGMRDSRYKTLTVTYASGQKSILAGLAIEALGSGAR